MQTHRIRYLSYVSLLLVVALGLCALALMLQTYREDTLTTGSWEWAKDEAGQLEYVQGGVQETIQGDIRGNLQGNIQGNTTPLSQPAPSDANEVFQEVPQDAANENGSVYTEAGEEESVDEMGSTLQITATSSY